MAHALEDRTERTHRLGDGHRLLAPTHDDACHRLGKKRDGARSRLDQHQSEGIDVCLCIESGARGLLGDRVLDGTDRTTARLGERRLDQRGGKPEIGDAQSTVVAEQEVGRLDVTMDVPIGMGDLECLRRLDAHLAHLRKAQPVPRVEQRSQTPTGQVLEHEVRFVLLALAPVMDADDIGVVQFRDGTGLRPESPEEHRVLSDARVQQLDRHLAVQPDVVGQEDVSRRTCADGSGQTIAIAEHPSDLVGHPRRCHQIRLSPRPSGLIDGPETGARPADKARKRCRRSTFAVS